MFWQQNPLKGENWLVEMWFWMLTTQTRKRNIFCTLKMEDHHFWMLGFWGVMTVIRDFSLLNDGPPAFARLGWFAWPCGRVLSASNKLLMSSSLSLDEAMTPLVRLEVRMEGATRGWSPEQWKKGPWLFRVYRGWKTTQVYRGTNQYNGK